MSSTERKALIRRFLPGIIAAVAIYLFATIFRDIRDNFSADMWKEMGYLNQPAIFTRTELPITLAVLALIGSMVFLQNSYRAFLITHGIIALGFIIAGSSTWLFLHQQLSPIAWMTLVGLGLYMVYIPFNSIYFERMIAAFRFSGNVGFLIYVADSFGYLGSVGVLMSKELFRVQLNWVNFFAQSVQILSIAGVLITLFATVYFVNKHKRESV